MLKCILILLGDTASSESARHYAIHLARQTGADVAGLAGVDLNYIEAPMPGGIGSASYKTRLEQTLRKQADDTRLRMRDTFERECHENNISCEWLSFEGDPGECLPLAAETRDIIVTGHDTAYRGNIRDPLPEMLSKLLLATPRPVVVSPDKPPTGTDVLIAYDGSLPAMRAVQLFALLGPWRSSRIAVVSVDASHEVATRASRSVADYLTRHEYHVESHAIASEVHPSEELRRQVADRKVGTLVMGAYGRRGIREFLFGSTTSALVETPPCALFLYH